MKVAKNQDVNVTFNNLAYQDSSLKIVPTEEANVSPDSQQPEPMYEHIDRN